MTSKSSTAAGLNCGCALFVLFVNMTLGALAFDCCLWSIFGKTIPWWADMICGAVMGQVVIPAAVVCLVLRACGIEAPFVR